MSPKTVGDGGRVAGGRRHLHFTATLHQRFLALAMGDKVGDRDLLQSMLFGKGLHVGTAHHRAIVADKFANDADGRQPCQFAEVDGRFGMTGPHQHAAFAGDERENVARADEIGRAGVGVGEVADRGGAIIGRNAGRCTVPVVDGYCERRRMGAFVLGHHRRQVQPAGLLARHRRADDARGVAHDEGHLFRRAMHGRDDQVALVLAAVIVHDDNDLAALEGTKRLHHLLLVVGHRGLALDAAGLAAMSQIMVGNGAGDHRLADRHRPDADARIVTSLGDDIDLAALAVDGAARI
jgi:hypothetical protein